MLSELDIAASIAILLSLGILAGSILLRISDTGKEPVSTPDFVPPWSIGWVNFGLFICALIISVSFTQSLVTKLMELSTASVTADEADNNEAATTAATYQPTEETELINQNPWIWVLFVLSLQIPMAITFFGLRSLYPETFGGSLNRKFVSIRRALLETAPYFIRYFPIIWLTGLVWLVVLTGFKKLGIVEEFQRQQLTNVIVDGTNPLVTGLLVTFAVALAPFVEEIIFRGAIYRFLKGETHTVHAQIISGTLFAALHFNLYSFMPLLVMGILLARIYEQGGNILLPIIFHAYWNGFSLLMLFLTTQSKVSFW